MNLRLSLFLLASTLMVMNAHAQSSESAAKPATKPSAKTKRSAKPATSSPSTSATSTAPVPSAGRSRRPNQSGWRAQLLFWQESIELTNGTTDAHMETQSQGALLSYVWNRPFRGPRWSMLYTVDVGAGMIKGKGDSAAIPDNFANQAWFMAGGSLGFNYRTSVVSSLTFSLPVAYRMISWRLTPGSPTNPGRDSSFNAGLSGIFALQITPRSQLQFAVTDMYMWKATQLSLGWQTMFR
ncbi:MAG: hypothetical protein KF799_01015 [Bdellovibrionales bacterium]|nr:hypothetical protein [Bdellovibrionales bacterium]